MFVQLGIDSSLGMGQKLLKRKVGRRAIDVQTRNLLRHEAINQQINRNFISKAGGHAVGIKFNQVNRQRVIDILNNLNFLVIAIGLVDRTLDLGGKLLSIILTRANINADRLVTIIDIDQQKVFAPKDVAFGIAGFLGGVELHGVGYNLDQLVAFFAKVESGLFALQTGGLRRHFGLQ